MDKQDSTSIPDNMSVIKINELSGHKKTSKNLKYILISKKKPVCKSYIL